MLLPVQDSGQGDNDDEDYYEYSKNEQNYEKYRVVRVRDFIKTDCEVAHEVGA